MKQRKARRDFRWLLIAAAFSLVACLTLAGPSVLSQSPTSGEVEFEAELTGRPFAQERRRQLAGELELLKSRAQDLVKDVARIGSAVTAQIARQVA